MPKPPLFLSLCSLFACAEERPELVINEFMADNATTVSEGDGAGYADWIELYNAGSELLLLERLYITDDLQQPTAHNLGAELSIDAGGFLLLWAVGEAGGDPTHLGFKLAAGGEELGLYVQDFDTGNLAQLDAIAFDQQNPDVSMARQVDGVGAWELSHDPTPGTSNR